MSIKANVVKCPQCGADLPVEEGKKQFFCSYCGTKVIITNENEHIYHHVNETGVKFAEAVQKIGLKKVELAEKKFEANEKRLEANEKKKAFKIKLSIALAIVALISLGIGYTFNLDGILVVGTFAFFMLIFVWPKK